MKRVRQSWNWYPMLKKLSTNGRDREVRRVSPVKSSSDGENEC